MRTVYLWVLAGAVVATAFLIAPVAFHRSVFYLGERPWLLAAANRTARAGLATLALTICGVVWIAFAAVESTLAGTVAAGGALLRSEEHTSELQSRGHLVCRLLLEKKNRTLS